MSRPRVTLVLASIDAKATIEASLRGFLAELGPDDRLLVADASRDSSASLAKAISGRVEIVHDRPGTLAPVLWRNGLVLADTDLVAFSTAQMVPRSGWLSGLIRGLERENTAGTGGPIAAGRTLAPIDRAMYLLRYANYLPPVPESAAFDPPGDNAIYRRDSLLKVATSWREGFWEIEVHGALRSTGLDVSMASDAIVEFRGGCSLRPAMAHRMAHARRYGASRTRGRSAFVRLMRSATAPMVPPLLASRIVKNLHSRREAIGPWVSSLPQLGALLTVWSIGEATGALFGEGDTRAA